MGCGSSAAPSRVHSNNPENNSTFIQPDKDSFTGGNSVVATESISTPNRNLLVTSDADGGQLDASTGTALPEEPIEATKRLRDTIGGAPCVCILGGTDFHGEDSEELVQYVASELSKQFGSRISFVTGGMAGVQKAFANSCSKSACLWHVLPYGHSSDIEVGTALHAGTDLDQRRHILGLLGDIYITAEGGPGVSEEAGIASSRGALIIPLMRTGGASAGAFDFPTKALKKPDGVSEKKWALLANKSAPLKDVSAAVANIVEMFVQRVDQAKKRQSPIEGCDLATGSFRSNMSSETLMQHIMLTADTDADGFLDRHGLDKLIRRVDSHATESNINAFLSEMEQSRNVQIDVAKYKKSLLTSNPSPAQAVVLRLCSQSHCPIDQLFAISNEEESGVVTKLELLCGVLRVATMPNMELDHILKDIDAEAHELIGDVEVGEHRILPFNDLRAFLSEAPEASSGGK